MTRPAAERTLARQLRADGWSLREIAAHIGIALATASEWVREVESPGDAAPREQSHRMLVIWRSHETRRCARCGLLLPLELFNRYRDGRQGWCRRCFVDYHADNREAASGRRTARVKRAREFVIDHLRSNPCVDCSLGDLVVLEFDHVESKRDWVSRLITRGAPLSRIQEELERCEVVCVNCHRRRSAERGGSRRVGPDFVPSGHRPLRERNYRYLFDVLRTGCIDCGESDLVVLDFDHREKKNVGVSVMARNECSLAKLQREIDLCDIRCGNCHRRRTTETREWWRGGVSARG